MAWPSSSARTKTWGTEILTAADLDGQFDVLHTYNNDQLNGTTGHKHSGGTNDGPLIPLTTGVTGTLPLANGGTGQTTLAGLLGLIYPVGSVYTNISVSTNPATLLGFGTWSQIGGFIAGQDGSTEFLTAGQTGGEKTHTLTSNEMPAHTHTYDRAGNGAGGTTSPGGSGTGNVSTNSGSTGGGAAHNTLPPYTVGYIWKRTA